MFRYVRKSILPFIVIFFSFPASASDELLGIWEITGAKFTHISGMDLNEAKKLFGDTIEYRKDVAIIRKELCKTPVYTTHEYNEDDFRSLYGATFKQLDITGTKVRTFEIQCRELGASIGSFFILLDERTGYTIWDSVFYKLNKK